MIMTSHLKPMEVSPSRPTIEMNDRNSSFDHNRVEFPPKKFISIKIRNISIPNEWDEQ